MEALEMLWFDFYFKKTSFTSMGHINLQDEKSQEKGNNLKAKKWSRREILVAQACRKDEVDGWLNMDMKGKVYGSSQKFFVLSSLVNSSGIFCYRVMKKELVCVWGLPMKYYNHPVAHITISFFFIHRKGGIEMLQKLPKLTYLKSPVLRYLLWV